jgi:hypothetical protein
MTMIRYSYVADTDVLLDAGVKVYDINVNEPITSLFLRFEAINGATNNLANLLQGCISAIEVIDGSEVLFSLPGDVATALAAYQQRHFPVQGMYEWPTLYNQANIPILFGRWLDDESMAFDPTKFANPQVRIRWNLAAVRAVGATGYVSGSLRVTIIAQLLEGIVAPVGMLMSKVWKTWITATGGTEYSPLPTDYPYRSMLIQAYLTGHSFGDVIYRVKINCDNGKYIPLDAKTYHLIVMLEHDGYRFDYRHAFHLGDGATIYPALKYEESVQLLCQDLTDVVYTYAYQGYGEGVCRVFQAGAAHAGMTNAMAQIDGQCPFSCLLYNFGEDTDPNTWFNPNLYKSVRAEILGHQTAAPALIVLTQARPF